MPFKILRFTKIYTAAYEIYGLLWAPEFPIHFNGSISNPTLSPTYYTITNDHIKVDQ